jgi:non-ribosomal peptide synthase protein (TIGR01720 family)
LPRREVIFNYVGQFELPASDTALVKAVPQIPPAMEDPENMRDFLLQCQVGIFSGRLTALWNYSENVHRHGTVERLNDFFLEALRSLTRGAAAPEIIAAPGKRTPARASGRMVAQEGGE